MYFTRLSDRNLSRKQSARLQLYFQILNFADIFIFNLNLLLFMCHWICIYSFSYVIKLQNETPRNVSVCITCHLKFEKCAKVQLGATGVVCLGAAGGAWSRPRDFRILGVQDSFATQVCETRECESLFLRCSVIK